MKRKLGKFESAALITNEHYPFNAVIVLGIGSGPSKETLQEALKHMQRRHPLLGVHVQKEKNRYFFVWEGTPDILLKVKERKNSEHWQLIVEEELNEEIDIFKGPPVCVTYLMGSGRESEIIITFQHAVIDAGSTANFLHELLSLCEKIENPTSFFYNN